MKKEKEVPYSKEQAEQVLKDENKFNGVGEVLFRGDKEFLNHKFPPKIEYVGKVWKTTTDIIFLCDKEADNGDLAGYGLINSISWFKGVVVNRNLDLTEATPTEWIEALEKYAESKYNVGDEVKCLSLNNPNEKIVSLNHDVNKFNYLKDWWATAEVGAALLMSDGIWADIITPAKDELNEKLKELTKLAESQGKNLKITFEN